MFRAVFYQSSSLIFIFKYMRIRQRTDKTEEAYHEKALEKIETKNQKHHETHLTFFFFPFFETPLTFF